jgi:phosphopentomutase
MNPRSLLIVLDSFGCGGAPDAAVFGDAGANTLGHLFAREKDLHLPHLASLGLYATLREADPDFPLEAEIRPGASHAILTQESAGKDSATGHWELMGIVLRQKFSTFEKFPRDVIREIEKRGGVKFLGNLAASGTTLMKSLGAEHLATGRPILYTSADSVMQIAAHEDPAIFGLDRLLPLCRLTRQILDERGVRLGRVIARPFIGDSPDTFQRTANRHDYSLLPPFNTLNRLQEKGVHTLGIGKVSDLFAGSGLTESIPAADNRAVMTAIDQAWANPPDGPQFIFATLSDFDTLYGHLRDPAGYARALQEFDAWLGNLLEKIGPQDLLIVTGDHGNDPYHRGSDHTRERVPALSLHAPIPASRRFKDISTMIEKYVFPLPPEYFQTVFYGEPPETGWPPVFSIITAYNPRSISDTDPEENLKADLELHHALLDRGLQPFRVTGASPDGTHQEPGWGITVKGLEVPAEFAKRFDQIAFFRIEKGEIFIHRDASGDRWPVAKWQDRWQGEHP